MKKLSKILVVLLSVCLLATAAMLVVSAEEAAIDGTYAVDGKGYDSWSDAVAAAAGTKTIYLNEDVTVSSTYTITSKVHLDLNSHKITFTKTSKTEPLFRVNAGGDFELSGEGELAGVNCFCQVSKGAKGSINGLGDGIKITSSGSVDVLINAYMGSELYVSGDIHYTPAKLSGYFMMIGEQKTALSDIIDAKVTFDGARITVDEPTNDVRYSTTRAINFFMIREGAKLTIKNNSVIDLIYGNMFTFGAGGYAAATYTATGTGAVASEITSAPIELTIRVDVDDSKLYAKNSGYNVLRHNSSAGSLIGSAYAGFYMTLDNVDLIGCNRTIYGITQRSNYNLASAKLEFTNVNFTTSDNVAYLSSWLTAEKLNLVWDGGVIDLRNAVCTTAAEFSMPKTADGDPFGAAAVAAAKALGYDISPAKYKVVMYSGENNNGSPLDTWSYHTYNAKGTGYNALNGGGIGYAEYVAVKNPEGKITGYRLAAAGETPDTWFGTKFVNVAFTTAPASPGSAPNGTSALYTIEGTKYDNVKISTGLFETKTYTVGYFTELPTAAHNLVGSYSGLYNPTTAWSKTPTAADDSKTTTTGTRPFDSVVEAVRDFGTASAVVGANGSNGYFKWFLDPTATGTQVTDDSTANPYFEMKIGPYPSNPIVSKVDNKLTVTNDRASDYSIQKYRFIVQEFDVSTDTGVYPAIGSALITRGGTITAAGAGTIAQVHYGINPIKLAADGKVTPTYNSGSAMESKSGGYQLPTDGSWARITFIYEFSGWVDAGTYTVAGETRAQSKMLLTCHTYIDGNWIATYTDIIKPIDNELKATVILDAMRFNPSATKNSSILIDNTRTSYYKADDPACADIAKVTASYKAGFESCPELSIMPDNNTYYTASTVAKVDGVEYIYEKDAIAAIKPGSVVELYKNFETAIPVSGVGKLILNGFTYPGFISESYVVRDYGELVNFVAAKPSEIVTLHHKDTLFEIDDKNYKATLGSTIGFLVKADGEIAAEGNISKLVGWQTENGGKIVEAALVKDGVLVLAPVYENVKYYYTISVDGNIEYFTEEEKGNIVANVNAKLAADKTVYVVIWSDLEIATNTNYSIKKNASLYFDVNGYDYFMASHGGSKPMAFGAASGSHFYLYSSREGGVFANVVGWYSGTDARILGAPVWGTYNWNENDDNPAMHAVFGTVKDEAHGIDADGKNLTVMGSAIADIYCVSAENGNTANGFSDRDNDGDIDVDDVKERVTINIDGGTYLRFTTDGYGMFAARGPIDLSIKNATVVATNNMFGTDARFFAASLHLDVENSTLVCNKEVFKQYGSNNLFSALTAGSYANISSSVVFGGINPSGEGTVTLGAGTALAYPDEISDAVKLADGLVIANAKYDVSASYGVSNLVYTYTLASGPRDISIQDSTAIIKLGEAPTASAINAALSAVYTYVDTRTVAAYVDAPEKLAHITWYDNDNTTVIGETYNALVGEIVSTSELEGKVSLSYGNEWYDVRFTKWVLPELTAGELKVTPICDTPVANVTCLGLNMTLYTNFRLNYYLPAAGFEGFALKGISYDAEGNELLASETVEIDGVSYVMFSEFVTPSDTEAKVRYIHFSVGEMEFVQKISFGVEAYVTEILNDDAGEYTAADKIIVANIVRYANEHYKLNVDPAGYEAYNVLVSENSMKLVDLDDIDFSAEELDVDTTNIDDIVGAIGFLSSVDRPAFTVVYNSAYHGSVILPDGADGKFADWPAGNRGIFAYISYSNYTNYERDMLLLQNSISASGDITTGAAVEGGAWAAGDFVVSMTEDMLVEDLTSMITFVIYNADGTVVRGTYSLAKFLETNKGIGEYDCTMSLYALSIAAQEYAAK